jgi:hypothetical protein
MRDSRTSLPPHSKPGNAELPKRTHRFSIILDPCQNLLYHRIYDHVKNLSYPPIVSVTEIIISAQRQEVGFADWSGDSRFRFYLEEMNFLGLDIENVRLIDFGLRLDGCNAGSDGLAAHIEV